MGEGRGAAESSRAKEEGEKGTGGKKKEEANFYKMEIFFSFFFFFIKKFLQKHFNEHSFGFSFCYTKMRANARIAFMKMN